MKESMFENKTIGEIVASDFRTAKVFEKHGIDFCCGGKILSGRHGGNFYQACR